MTIKYRMPTALYSSITRDKSFRTLRFPGITDSLLARLVSLFLASRGTFCISIYSYMLFTLCTISPGNDPNRTTVSIPISITPTSASLIAASLFIAIHPLDKSIGPRVTTHLHTATRSLTVSPPPLPLSHFLSLSLVASASALLRETEFL